MIARLARDAGLTLKFASLTWGFIATLSGCATSSPRWTPSAVRHPKGDLALDDLPARQRDRVAGAQRYVTAVADRFGLDPDLVNGVIWVESRFDPRAVSPVGAKGLMQLMPATASELARQLEWPRPNRYDPAFNVTAGCFYLSRLLRHYDGDLRLALAAYNAGPGNVDRWRERGRPLPGYSRKYVKMVLEAQARFVAMRSGPTPRTTETRIAQAQPITRQVAPDRELATSPRRAQSERSRTRSPDRSGGPDRARARALAEEYRRSQERVRRARARLAAQDAPSDAPADPKGGSEPGRSQVHERPSARPESVTHAERSTDEHESVGAGVLPSVLDE